MRLPLSKIVRDGWQRLMRPELVLTPANVSRAPTHSGRCGAAALELTPIRILR